MKTERDAIKEKNTDQMIVDSDDKREAASFIIDQLRTGRSIIKKAEDDSERASTVDRYAMVNETRRRRKKKKKTVHVTSINHAMAKLATPAKEARRPWEAEK